jgi:hypothetical protein
MDSLKNLIWLEEVFVIETIEPGNHGDEKTFCAPSGLCDSIAAEQRHE